MADTCDYWNAAALNAQAAGEADQVMADNWPYWNDASWNMVNITGKANGLRLLCRYLLDALTHNNDAINFLYRASLHYCTLLNDAPWGGEDYELTAAKIMAAWIDANKDNRMMTVLTLDELRREAWNEEFISYKIAPPGPG